MASGVRRHYGQVRGNRPGGVLHVRTLLHEDAAVCQRPKADRSGAARQTAGICNGCGGLFEIGRRLRQQVLIETADIPDGARVLDVGCGYGPIGLAIAAARPSAHVTMIDINERAVKLARENAERNGIRNVTILESDLFEAVRDQTFDAVLTNPPIRAGKAVVHRIFEEAFERLVPGGALWVVIQKKQGAPSAEAKLEEILEQTT